MSENSVRTWPAPERPRRAPVALRVVETGVRLRLPTDSPIRVGSDPRAAVPIDDRYVSKQHCELLHTDGGLVIRDRRSRNGTFVNGARVLECTLEVGTRVRLGTTTLEVVGDERPGELAAQLGLVGEAPAFRAAVELAQRGAASEATVLLIGESGTGKELFARLVHDASPRVRGPFVAVNCGAISQTLVESELFGHERGAFTGADERRLGVFEQAQGGTLFLDEIGELPLDQQRRLLRVLETRRLRRVGGEGERAVDVRVVAATHRDLRDSRAFRADLYHRLAAIEVRIPPLRARREDIPLLARRFLVELAPGEADPLDVDLLARLLAHPWPGNVRELRNAMQRYAVMGAAALGELLSTSGDEAAHSSTSTPAPSLADVDLDGAMRWIIGNALEKHGTVRKAAEAVRMAKSTLHDRARRMGLRVTEE